MGFNPVEFLGGMLESGKDAMNERKETLDQIHKELEGLKKSLDKDETIDAKINEKMGKLQRIFTKECEDRGITKKGRIEKLWSGIELKIQTAILKKTPEFQDTLTFTNRLANLTGFKALTDSEANPNVAKGWFDKINEKCQSIFKVSAVAIVKLLKEFEGMWGGEKDADGNPKEGMFSRLYKKLFIYSGEHKTKFEEYKQGIHLPEGFALEGKYSKKDVVEMVIKNSEGEKVGKLQFNPSGEQITLILEDKNKTSYPATNAEEMNEYLTAENLGGTPKAPPAGEAETQTDAAAETLSPLHQSWVDKLKGLKADKIVADLADLKSIKAITEDAEIDQLIENANLRDSNFDKVIKVVAKKIGSQSFEVRLADLYLQKRSTDDITLMTSIISGEKSEYKTLDTSEKIREFLIKSYRKPTLKEAIKDFEKGSA